MKLIVLVARLTSNGKLHKRSYFRSICILVKCTVITPVIIHKGISQWYSKWIGSIPEVSVRVESSEIEENPSGVCTVDLMYAVYIVRCGNSH